MAKSSLIISFVIFPLGLLFFGLASPGGAAPSHSLYLPLVSKVQSLQNGDFEKGRDGSWKETSINGYPLILTGADLEGMVPQGGNWAVWLGGQVMDTSALSQVITVPENASALQFYYWIESYELPENCIYDYAVVRFGSTVLRTIYLCESKNTGQWVSDQIDLSGLRGQTGELTFELVNDEVDHSNFFLDTVSITGS